MVEKVPWGDHSLERIEEKFKNFGEFDIEWTEAGVSDQESTHTDVFRKEP